MVISAATRARGAKIKAALRKRQAAGQTGTSGGKFTKKQRRDITAPQPAPRPASAPEPEAAPEGEMIPSSGMPSVFNQPEQAPLFDVAGTLARAGAGVSQALDVSGRAVKTALIGGVTVTGGAVAASAAIAIFSSVSAVAVLSKVGTTGLITSYKPLAVTVGGTVSKIAVNSATTAATTSWITRLATGAVRNPITVAGTIVAAIGSYPFAGFIKEEALQTTGFAVNTAVRNDDVEGAEKALELQEEILNPSVWEGIVAKVPYANVLGSLNKFYEAARLKMTIDRKMVEDMKIRLETGESEVDRQKRNRQEEADQYKANIDYYNSERKKMLLWELEARRAQRNRDAEFWRREKAKQVAKEAEDRAAIAAFWIEYRKAVQKLNDENRPSKLNFGIV